MKDDAEVRSAGTPTPAFLKLADSLDRLPNGFPRTGSGVETRILRKIFSEEEAALACQLTGQEEPFDAIAARVGLQPPEARKRLIALAKRGLVWVGKQDEKLAFRLAPFIVGIYEAQASTMDHELAHLVERYMEEGGAAGIMGPQPALHRVVPAHGALKSESILPYDDVKAIILSAKSFHAGDCICRIQMDKLEKRECSFPIHNCLSFSSAERHGDPGAISQEEALAILDESEEIGLVHTVSNVTTGVSYVCNCCGCCCGILLGITRFGIEGSVARANYFAEVTASLCTGCGACLKRCPVGAMAENDGIAVVQRQRCIGCGLCVTGCPEDAVALNRKPDAEAIHPPVDFAAWEKARLAGRGGQSGGGQSSEG